MTEYDFSPEGFERYRSTQDRIAQWVGSSEQYPSMDPSMIPAFDDGRGYRNEHQWGPDGHASTRRGRRRRRAHHDVHQQLGYDQNISGSGMLQPNFNERTYSPTGGHRVPMGAPQVFDLGDGQPYAGLSPGDLPPPLGSRNGSANPLINEPPPLQEHYSPPTPRGHSMDHMQNISANYGAPYHPSYLSSRPMIQRSPLPISVPVSATESLFRSESDEWSRSYSSDSYSSRSSRSFGSHPYRTVHASSHTPTVIQPSRHYPIVVPINGGVGGYVVVPAIGQNLQVVVSYNLFTTFLSDFEHSLGTEWEIQVQA